MNDLPHSRAPSRTPQTKPEIINDKSPGSTRAKKRSIDDYPHGSQQRPGYAEGDYDRSDDHAAAAPTERP